MKNINSIYGIRLLAVFFILSQYSCNKFLDAKPNENLGTLETNKDVQLFLDDYSAFNQAKYPVYGEIGADTYYLTSSSFNSIIEEPDRDTYRWLKHINGVSNSWSQPFSVVYLANIALDELRKMNAGPDQVTLNNQLKGSALFFRCFYLHALTQLYTLPYDKASSSVNLGIPLRLDPDFKVVSNRESLQKSYMQIVTDLKEAANLLPTQDLPKTRPTKSAAYALLARVYLSMREYDSVGVYANKSLLLYNDLLQYSDLTATSSSPIPQYNKEILFWSTSGNPTILSISNAKIDPGLYQSYSTDDLRKTVFFRTNTGANAGTYAWKGGYHGSGTYVFGGLVTDEVYLMRAESYARAGNKELAMKDLNDLLRTRWRKVNGVTTYIDQTAVDANDAVNKVLSERKKELLYRGLRWLDMRRLSMEPEFAKIYIKTIDANTYELRPGSSRYALQIPIEVIQKTGMQQNP